MKLHPYFALPGSTHFFDTKGMDSYGCPFTLDGKQLIDRHVRRLVAVNVDTSQTANNARAKMT